MERVVIIILLQMSYNLVYAQSFAPVGAKWYYTELYVGPGNWEDEYALEAEALSDTIIKGKECVEIQCDYLCWFPYGSQYVYSSNDTVYLFDQLLDTFKILYRFNAIAGDEWNIPIWGMTPDYGDYFRITIDSVSTIMVNDTMLNEQFVTYSCNLFDKDGELYESFWYSSRIIERIGDVTYLFNIPQLLLTWCDHNYSNGLRCYEDSVIGLYQTGLAPTCDYEFVNVYDLQVSPYSLYPNPTNDFLYFDQVPEDIRSIDIFDYTGNNIQSYPYQKAISLRHMENGLYFIKIVNSMNKYDIIKIIKIGS